MRLVGVAIANAGFLIALLIAFGCFQRYSPPLTGCIAGENKGVKPHGLNAVYPFGFMCRVCQFIHSFIFNGANAGPLPIFLKSPVPFVSVDLGSESQLGK